MDDIKKCPFCGGEAELHSIYSEKAEKYYIYVQCCKCWAKAMTINNESPAGWGIENKAGVEAIRAWNRRTGA